MRHAVASGDAGREIMKTYPVLTKDGSRAFAFEIENIYISPGTAARLVAAVDGVADVKLRRMFSKSSDVHIEFNYHGQPYILWEPFGDSSRYWIGPKEESGDVGNIAALEATFKGYRPPLYRTLLGDLLMLRFITRFLDRSRHTS